MKFISISKLPFQIVEHPDFQEVIHTARTSPVSPPFPTGKTIQRHLLSTLETTQNSFFDHLPSNAKISIALDCWTSPFQQAFMAITGYFIDDSWSFREVLLAFEPLHGSHTGANLGRILLQVLEKYNLTQRVLAITTDNASNNATLVQFINRMLDVSLNRLLNAVLDILADFGILDHELHCCL